MNHVAMTRAFTLALALAFVAAPAVAEGALTLDDGAATYIWDPESVHVGGGAQVAQLVEQGTENPRVGSSNLSLGTIFSLRASIPETFQVWSAPRPSDLMLRDAAVPLCALATRASS